MWIDTYAIPGWKYEEWRRGREPLDERLLEPNWHSAECLKKVDQFKENKTVDKSPQMASFPIHLWGRRNAAEHTLLPRHKVPPIFFP